MMGIVGIKNQTCATVLYLFKIGIDLSEFKKIAELKKLYYPYPYIMFHQFTSLRSPISCTDLFGNIQREGSLRKIWNARCAFGISKAWVAGTFKLVTHHTLATHTFCKLTFFSTIFRQCFNKFSTTFGAFQNRIEHSKAKNDVLKQKRMF